MRQKALLQCEGVNQDMERKTALVTGSAKGIGRSIALKLAEKGYDIIVNAKSVRPDFNGETAYDVQRLVEETGRKAYSCIADISSHEGRQKILDCVDEIGRVDILVNNAGIEPPGKDVLEVTGEELELVLGTNFYGCRPGSASNCAVSFTMPSAVSPFSTPKTAISALARLTGWQPRALR